MATPPEDWQSTRCLSECNSYMLDNQVECDVTFLLTDDNGDPVRMHAHKFVLISRSPVFFAMLSGPLAERDKEIRVTDISPETFDQILRFLYSEIVDMTEGNVFVLLYAARKYLLTLLAKLCVEYLTSSLSAENVCVYIENDFLLEGEHDLQRQCMNIIRKHSKKVFLSEAFNDLSREALCRVLRADKLTIHEIDVFRSCVQWATDRCSENGLELNGQNRREMLGDVLKYIHFPTLAISEFTNIVVPSGLLTSEEENYIFRYLLSNREENVNDKDLVPFPTLNRESVECKCALTYDGLIRQTTTYTSLFQGIPQRSKWSISIYTDHTIKLKDITFLGKFKGSLFVSQNNIRKFDATCNVHVSKLDLEEDNVSLDAGLFTIASESPFSYMGEYYSKGVTTTSPGIQSDQDKVSVLVKDSSPLCFLSQVIFLPTDEMHFVDDYYGGD